MAFESLLATDSLLTIIAGLLTMLNFNQSRIKGYMDKSVTHLKALRKYFALDIRIRNRLEKKADIIFAKAGVTKEMLKEFNDKIDIQTDLDLIQLEEYEFDD